MSKKGLSHHSLRRAGALVIVGLAALALPGPAQGAEEALVTDRPDFTESAVSVAPGRVQVEGGATFERAGDAETWTVGEVLVRIGLAERLELRVDAGSRVSIDPGPEGYADPGLGVKWELAERGTSRWALIVATSVPAGSGEIGSPRWQPEAVLAASWELSPRLGLGANLGYAHPDDDGRRFDQAFGSVALGLALGGRWGVFGELYGFSRETIGGDEATYADAGLTYGVQDDLQLDLRLGTGLSGTDTDTFVGAGLAYRW